MDGSSGNLSCHLVKGYMSNAIFLKKSSLSKSIVILIKRLRVWEIFGTWWQFSCPGGGEVTDEVNNLLWKHSDLEWIGFVEAEIKIGTYIWTVKSNRKSFSWKAWMHTSKEPSLFTHLIDVKIEFIPTKFIPRVQFTHLYNGGQFFLHLWRKPSKLKVM